jgi:hypothetical protein
MSNKEKLNFKIGLSGTYWDKKPKYSVLIDNTVVKSGEVSAASDEIFYVEFDFEFEESAKSTLCVRLNNKTDSDVKKDNYETEDYNIIGDLLLHINSLEIDEIDVGQLIWTNSRFIGDEKSRGTIDNCVDLGWNGTWEFPFESPFYIWLLEKI